MPYSGAVATFTMEDILTELVDFAVANAGFTDLGALPLGGGRNLYRLSKDGMYWWFKGVRWSYSIYSTDVIQMRMQSAVPTLEPNNTEDTSCGPDNISFCMLWKFGVSTNCVASYFFTDIAGKAVHCAIEVAPNIFTHLSFGHVEKYGTWNGGGYVCGLFCGRVTSSGFEPIRNSYFAPIFTGHLFSTSNATYYGHVHYARNSFGDYRDYAAIGRLTHDQLALFSTPNMTLTSTLGDGGWSANPFVIFFHGYYKVNLATQRIPLFPQILRLWDPTMAKYLVAGHVPGTRCTRLVNNEPKDIVSENWQLFPLTYKGTLTSVSNSTTAPMTYDIGMAYEMVE